MYESSSFWEQTLAQYDLEPVRTFGRVFFDSSVVTVVPLAEGVDFVDDSSQDDYEEVLARMLPEEVKRCLAILSEQQREILRLRHGFDGSGPRTKACVGEVLEISVTKVSNTERYAHSMLRKFNVAKGDAVRNLIVTTF